MTEAIQRIRTSMQPAPTMISPSLTVADAADRMQINNVRHLPVIRDGVLVGLISDRDFALVDGLSGRTRAEVRVAQVMRRPFICHPEESLVDVVRVMLEKNLEVIVVVEDNAPIGIFSTMEAMHRLIEIAQLLELMARPPVSS